MEQLERDSELYKTYVEKFAAQEQEFEKLREEIKALKADQAAKEKELEQYILGLNIDSVSYTHLDVYKRQISMRWGDADDCGRRHER